MGLYHSPRIVLDNLLLYVDGANSITPRIGSTSLTPNGGVSAPSNGYYTFDGTNDSYSINSSVYDLTYTGKTVIVAAKMSTLFGAIDRYRGFIGTDATSASRNFNFYMYLDATGFRFHFSAGNGTASSGSFSDYLNLGLDQWFIGAVSQNSSNFATYYLNDKTVGTKAQTFCQFNTGTNEFIGRNNTFWIGDIAYWLVYGKALSAEEIQQNFNALRGRYGL